MAVIETNGISDRILYTQVMAGIGAAYSDYGVGDGNYPNKNDFLTDRGLWNIWMRNNLNARIFVDGMGITSRTAQAQGVSSVRVPLMAPPPYTPRTISINPYPGVTRPGTPGNDGIENINLPNVPQSNGVDIYFDQLYDQPTVIYKLSQNMVSLPIAAQYTAQIPETVANMEDTTIMATQIRAGLLRASQTENSNVVAINTSNTTQGYLQQQMNALIGLMTNPQTSWSEGIVYYDLMKSVIVMKQSFFNQLFTVSNGVLVNGGNLSQEMLVKGAFTPDGTPKGNLIRGMYSSVYIKVVPDSYWRQAAAYIGITAEQYPQYDKVVAYIANSEGTGFGVADTTINPVPNAGSSVGTKIQNLWQWGCQVIRPSSVGLVITSSNGTLSDFTNPISADGNIVAPQSFDSVISSYGTSSVDYGNNSNIGIYDDKTTTTVTLTLTTASSGNVSNAALKISASTGNSVGYTNNMDGTYTFVLPRNSSATVTTSAVGYDDDTISISTSNTASSTYATSKQLTASE